MFTCRDCVELSRDFLMVELECELSGRFSSLSSSLPRFEPV